MKGTIQDFKKEARLCDDCGDADFLAMKWLKLLCIENSKDGERAEVLLKVVGDLLGIDTI